MKSRRKQTYILVFILFILTIGLGIGFAVLSASLNINGNTNIDRNTWNVFWDNIQVTNGSVTGTQVTTAPTINTPKTTVSFRINLKEPGEFYEFMVDAKNTGTIDAMVDTITKTTNIPAYLNYTVTYNDGTEIASKHLLATNSEETYKVRVEYRDDINPNQLPSTPQSISLSFGVTYLQADSTAVAPTHAGSFATDSWDTIVGAIRSNNASLYSLGDTKEVDMGSLGTHTLRIINTSTPAECANPGFSQTACGFVLEFTDIIAILPISSNGLNTGGWRDCEVRPYVNNDVYNALPTSLKNAIINTTVVSGYGYNDTANFVTTDKLYLLSFREVLYDDPIQVFDTAWSNTRQVDYYSNIVPDFSGISGLIKKYNNTDTDWWTRTPANYGLPDDFIYVEENGELEFGDNSDYPKGVSPAFRIG